MSGKIIITGPGRSGTSFLIQLLTRLGQDTGYKPYKEAYSEDIRAGCEKKLKVQELKSVDDFIEVMNNAPRIFKGPIWAYYLKFMMLNKVIEIDHIVMPLRDLSESAVSRLDVGLDFMMDKEYIQLPGDHLVEVQENVLAMLTGKVLEFCYLYDVPLTLMRFPKLVQDMGYCYRKVSEFVDVDRNNFGVKWLELVQ